jgi:hypothetical protein
MALGEALGRLVDVEQQISAGASHIGCVSLKDAAGVTFVCTGGFNGGGDTFTVKQSGASVAASGVFTAFNPITRYYTKATLNGTSQWVDSGDLAANLGTVTIGSGAIAFYVGADDLPAGSMYVEVVPGTSGIVTAILHDLEVQRNPKYLRAPNS